MPPPPRVSKHGTLDASDVDGAVPVDTDEVLRHRQSSTASTVFGELGGLPPTRMQAVERRFTPYWRVTSSTGEDWVGLTKANSDRLGTFVVENLVPGDYKLTLKLDKQLNANPVTSLTGTVLGGIKSLTLSGDKDKAEEAAARGIPSQYMDVRVRVAGKRYSISDIRGELDLGVNNALTRTFSVREADGPVTIEIKCVSHSLVKRLKLQGVLLRCDPEPPRKSYTGGVSTASSATSSSAPVGPTVAEKAKMGRELVSRAFSGAAPPAAAAAVPAPAPAPAARAAASRGHAFAPDVDARAVLAAFYAQFAPEKVNDVDRVLNHFLSRDGHTGLLVKTLEDKYHVKFRRDGTWELVDVAVGDGHGGVPVVAGAR